MRNIPILLNGEEELKREKERLCEERKPKIYKA